MSRLRDAETSMPWPVMFRCLAIAVPVGFTAAWANELLGSPVGLSGGIGPALMTGCIIHAEVSRRWQR
jgi:hypothetical protein